MDYITTTNLRTKSSELVASLEKGEKVTLIHRSKVIGVIEPRKEERNAIKFDAKKFEQLVRKLNLPETTYEEREKRYREQLMKKYGKDFS